MNRNKIQLLIKSGLLPQLPTPTSVAMGYLISDIEKKSPYVFECGLCYDSIIECMEWEQFTSQVIISFLDANPDLVDPNKTIKESIMLEDFHWDWMGKAIQMNSDEYLWFFLKIEKKVQAVSIIYHPKKTAALDRDIYYIEYLSVAPWNRPSKLYPKKYQGVGKEVLREVQKYINLHYDYEYGFSLHSLPQSKTFYEHIGMNNHPVLDKGPLSYFEMNYTAAKNFAEVPYAV